MIKIKQKGITLVALIITIIVMMILVGVSVSMVINSDLLGTAKRAGELYGQSVNSESSLGEITIDGTTYASIEDYLAGNPKVSSGQYEEKGGVYVNRPDLTGFSREHTYYVTYDSSGVEHIEGLITTAEPDDWYNYSKSSKIWANVVTINDGNTAYWVWIPRYAYKIAYENADGSPSQGNAITSYGKVEVIFLSKDNVHKDYETGATTTYTEASLAAAGYTLPDAFTWEKTVPPQTEDGEATIEKVPLAGYWVSKYEVSEALDYGTSFNIAKTENSIEITKIDKKNTEKTYEYYLNGELKSSGEGLYKFEDLEPNTEYEITIKERYKYLEEGVVTATRKIRTNIERITNSVPPVPPDVSELVNTNAYYVLYDATGAEYIGEKIALRDGKLNLPTSNWYDYGNKIWANIVTSSEPLTEADKQDMANCTKNLAYWVWIPRYEYKLIDTKTDSDYLEGDTITTQAASINFIGTNVVTPTIDGYTIPDAFTWQKKVTKENGEEEIQIVQLPGYWVSKYEVSEATTQTTT